MGWRGDLVRTAAFVAFSLIAVDTWNLLTGEGRPGTGPLLLVGAMAAVTEIGRWIWHQNTTGREPEDPDLSTIRAAVRRGEPVPEFRLAQQSLVEADRVAPQGRNRFVGAVGLVVAVGILVALTVHYLGDDRRLLAFAAALLLTVSVGSSVARGHTRRRADATRRSAEQMLAMAPASARAPDRNVQVGPLTKARLYLGIRPED